ncbi:MAG TPA: cyanophycinase [Candidatus Acidoferrales bacterium]|nr:cyanophycinase [Candidatus Acidoferrales bacterium]
MSTRKTIRNLALCAVLAGALLAASIGPARGTLVIVGGGQLGPEIVNRFIELAGGPDAPMVFIPTAEDGEPKAKAETTFLAKAGVKNVVILHTRDPKVADSEEFVAPLLAARGVWFEGGRQWRLADAYLNTRVEKELFRLLERGGVVGGSSAGATIQGSYLVRGAVEGNTVMMSPGHEQGLAFLRESAIDQHVLTRHREDDLNQVIERFPALLGIGIDESTAIVVQGNQFEVIGKSKVLIHDAHYQPQADGKRYYVLSAGDRFDLEQRRKINP